MTDFHEADIGLIRNFVSAMRGRLGFGIMNSKCVSDEGKLRLIMASGLRQISDDLENG